ncbi:MULTISPECIES: hypothetical protein [unclassified Cyanobium]|uniref:hypothetical protein n=1 Tax=unclassified Cyanobium TaxID=2627006 RepID=UPI0020CFB40A|nr:MULTISPECIES: hypothetical protein [unclassified Cyanobium]MCP9835004.1 hypothetical protein [Cyanobium sp. La Preciosa 7G6]MCP9937767.1 hypothetical protein [Cyanobium sp. Aljojuca 7A6]
MVAQRVNGLAALVQEGNGQAKCLKNMKRTAALHWRQEIPVKSMKMSLSSSALGLLDKASSCQFLSKSLFGAAVATVFASALSAGSASAATTTTCGIAADLTLGDKIISNILCSGVGAETEIRFGAAGPIYDFGTTIDPPAQSGSIAYTIAITDPRAFEFQAVGLGAGCAFAELGGCTVTKTVRWAGGFTSLVAVNGIPPSSYLFAPGVSTLEIEDVFFAHGQTVISVVNNSFIQRAAQVPPDSVPGPLPVLGAAAAFGFSRKLRARIRKPAPAL